jgi:hypothetical protein
MHPHAKMWKPDNQITMDDLCFLKMAVQGNKHLA